MTAVERVLDALRDHGCKVTGTGRQHMTQCPAHEDRNPSLSVTAGESRVLLRCHAGCDTDDVLTALGLSRADLFDESHEHRRSHATVVAEYIYTDEDGAPLFVKERLLPKSFLLKRPDGT
ncbi:hypothetical protein BH18ACT8_BH18ACT8_16290 [soil metagenome]